MMLGLISVCLSCLLAVFIHKKYFLHTHTHASHFYVGILQLSTRRPVQHNSRQVVMIGVRVYTHCIWSCPKIQAYWTDILQDLENISGVMLHVGPLSLKSL